MLRTRKTPQSHVFFPWRRLLSFLQVSLITTTTLIGCGQEQKQNVNVSGPEHDHTVSGVVADVLGPIEGATIQVGRYSDTSDAIGAYSIPGIIPGTYAITCNQGDYREFIGEVIVGNADKTFHIRLRKMRSVTVAAIEDAFTSQEHQDDNYGALEYMNIGPVPGEFQRLTYGFMKFNWSQLPGDAEVLSASLHFEARAAGPDDYLEDVQITVRGVASEWHESTITYANAPYSHGYYGSLEINAVPAHYYEHELDMTTYVQWRQNGTITDYGFVVDAGRLLDIASSESSTGGAPRCVISCIY